MILTCGLDEVGRGALAGPILGCGFVSLIPIENLVRSCPVPVRDSKTLSSSQRERVLSYLLTQPVIYKIESISVSEININGIGWANRELFTRIIGALPAHKYLIDGNLKINFENKNITSIVDGDAKYPEISLASIIAKVYRDDLMSHLHNQHPEYAWDSNKGYGTKVHQHALTTLGATPHHRHLFVRGLC